MKSKIKIRSMKLTDVVEITKAFAEQGWNKPQKQYRTYFHQQTEGVRSVLVAELSGCFAGYITVLWQSDDPYFRARKIPELKDFNVLIKYRQRGIGGRLMDEIEKMVFEKSDTVGLSVGLLKDYASAQRMYVKRGYIPTEQGIKQFNRTISYSEKVCVDDDLVLSFTKKCPGV